MTSLSLVSINVCLQMMFGCFFWIVSLVILPPQLKRLDWEFICSSLLWCCPCEPVSHWTNTLPPPPGPELHFFYPVFICSQIPLTHLWCCLTADRRRPSSKSHTPITPTLFFMFCSVITFNYCQMHRRWCNNVNLVSLWHPPATFFSFFKTW